MSRRMMFYHYILNEDSKSLIHRFYMVQSRKPVKNDWSLTVKENLKTLQIVLEEDQIKKLSIYSFKKLVNSAIKKESLNYLVKLKNSHSKVKHIDYEKLAMQDYLAPSRLSPEVAKFTFLCRSRMVQVGANFKKGKKVNPVCPLCKINSEYDSQPHLMTCTKLNVNTLAKEKIPQYDNLLSKNLEKKLTVVHLLKKNFQERKRILSQQK